MEGDEDMPPFWLQNADSTPRRLRRQASSVFLNPGAFLVALLVLAFTFVFVIVPSVSSFTSQIFRPHSIKKSWDSLNLLLVLFAIVCGFLSRNSSTNNESSSSIYYEDQSLSNIGQIRSQPSTPSRRWLEYQDRTVSHNTLNRLRSFSSYPDLRQESLERWRFYDDTHLNNYRFSTSNDHQIHHDHQYHHPQQQQEEETKKQKEDDDDVGVKDINVDAFVINQKEFSYPSSPPPPSPPPQPQPSPSPPSPPSPPPKAVRRKVKRTNQDLEYEKRTDHEEKIFQNLYNISPPSPPPPPPAMFGKSDKRRGKDFLISLRRKKKKQRQKSVENLESLFHPQPSTTTATLNLIPPPSPPPPPPPHFFQNLFSKKGKNKKLYPVSPPPPPPPPVARVSKVVSQKVTSKTKVQVAAVTSHKPPQQVKTGSSFNSVEEYAGSGNASPLIPIPPPPPPPSPPFKMSSWKFVRDGDYVLVGSFNGSRSGSPDLESNEDTTSDKDQSSPMAGGGSNSAAMPLLCPSPDVNTKADNFIARFREGLNLEKVNSVKGRSNLGPGASTSSR